MISTYLNTWNSFHLPPEAAKIHQTINVTNNKIQEIIELIEKIASDNILSKHPTVLSKPVRDLEVILSRSNALFSHYSYTADPAVEALLNESYKEFAKLIINFKQVIEDYHFFSKLINKDIDPLLNRLKKISNPSCIYYEDPSKKSLKYWYFRELPRKMTAFEKIKKRSCHILGEYYKSLKKSFLRHPIALASASVYAVTQRICPMIFTESLGNEFCPKTEPFNTNKMIMASLITTTAIVISLKKFKKSPRSTNDFEELNEQEQTFAKERISIALKRIGQEDMLIKLLKNKNPTAPCKAYIKAIKIGDSIYSVRVIVLAKGTLNNFNAQAEFNLLRQLGHLVNRDKEYGSLISRKAATITASYLLIQLPLPVSILLLDIIFRPKINKPHKCNRYLFELVGLAVQSHMSWLLESNFTSSYVKEFANMISLFRSLSHHEYAENEVRADSFAVKNMREPHKLDDVLSQYVDLGNKELKNFYYSYLYSIKKVVFYYIMIETNRRISPTAQSLLADTLRLSIAVQMKPPGTTHSVKRFANLGVFKLGKKLVFFNSLKNT
ncbi:MAG: hypothetical protein H0W88_04405 [Parachlamydiaceae bacterium]|nr:hypothetical protein [Parachlamydiaceae bacterium]